MSSPIGHSLMGVAVYAATVPRRRLFKAVGWLALCVGVSVLPDFDFILPAAVGRIDTAQWTHRTITHTVFFAFGIALVAFIIARLCKARPRTARIVGIIVLLCLFLHLALDIMNEDTRAPYGVALFWPVSQKTVYAPIGLFPRVEKATYADLVGSHNLHVALTELLLFGTLIVFILGVRFLIAHRRPAKSEKREGTRQQDGPNRSEDQNVQKSRAV